MTESDVETVADVLEDATAWPRDMAEQWVRDVTDHPRVLDYEQLVKPLKLTGGRVALMVELDTADPPWYYRWAPRGLEYHDGRDYVGEAPAVNSWLKHDIDMPRDRIEPVLVEDTPFSEEDDA